MPPRRGEPLARCQTDTGLKLYGGWHFFGPFAVEGVFFDWGEAELTVAADSLKTRARGLGLGVAYFIPLAAVLLRHRLWLGLRARLVADRRDRLLARQVHGDGYRERSPDFTGDSAFVLK